MKRTIGTSVANERTVCLNRRKVLKMTGALLVPTVGLASISDPFEEAILEFERHDYAPRLQVQDGELRWWSMMYPKDNREPFPNEHACYRVWTDHAGKDDPVKHEKAIAFMFATGRVDSYATEGLPTMAEKMCIAAGTRPKHRGLKATSRAA